MTRNREKNITIGACRCPFAGCEVDAPVYRYRQWSENKKLTRRAGQLYLVCPAHGMCSNVEWLTQHSTIDPGAEGPAAVDETPPAPESDATQSPESDDQDASKAKPSPKKAGSRPWGYFE